jgi:A/G-specific adenine glycosylase
MLRCPSTPRGAARQALTKAGPAPAALRRALLRWYDRHQRDLPWRRSPADAYRQWLAECMLQQTTVAAVRPYYEKFTSRFPDVAALAAAPLDEVLRLWAGLGYYARARHVHAAARVVVQKHAGIFPDSVQELLALPGIGRYTAGAIASIAFGRRAAAVDGNVRRVLSRLYASAESLTAPRADRRLWQLAEVLVPQRRCGDFNQALMDLGATVCTPRQPACTSCPLAAHCAARLSGRTAQLPGPGRRPRRRRNELVVAAILHRGRYLLLRRPITGLWGGLWEMPSIERPDGAASRTILLKLLARLGAQGADLRVPLRPTATLRRQLTHRDITMTIYSCGSRQTSQPIRRSSTRRWVRPADLDGVALAAAQRAALRAVMSAKPPQPTIN